MTPEDMAALHALCFTQAPRPWQTEEFAALLESPSVFPVSLGSGFAIGRCVSSEAELLTLAVHPSKRRKGIAAALLSAFELEAAKRRAADAFLEVSANNEAAKALYLSMGYREAGRRNNYYALGDNRFSDALILRKALGKPQAPPPAKTI